MVTPYVLGEVVANIVDFAEASQTAWLALGPLLIVMNDVLTLDRPAVFEPAKDRPILFGALAWADVLLTLDREDFGSLIGRTFYDLVILKPGTFLELERAAGRLVE